MPSATQQKLARLYARVSPVLAGRPGSSLLTRAHAGILRRSGGRVGRNLFGSPLLVLRTVGRRSGSVRESPAIYVRHGDGYVVVASNGASTRPPAWFLNLEATPDCEALVGGRWRKLHARAASEAEATELWPLLDATYAGFDHYRSVATREFPVVVLEPR
jgi:deazaflavin-dependent oxidoreductase (nitroreductase family)